MTQIIAHRGGYYKGIKENTLEAFQKAIEIGADFVEFDVHKTKDGKLVVIHDHEIHKKKIAEMSYAELKEETQKDNYTAPLFEEVLEITRGKIKMDIEIKSEGYEKEIVEIVTKNFNYEQFIISSFIDNVVIKIKEIDNNIKTGLLIGVENPKYGFIARIYEAISLEKRIRKANPDFTIPHVYFVRCFFTFFIFRIQRLKKPIILWTVNRKKVIENLVKKDIEGIITNNPELALKLRNSTAQTMIEPLTKQP